MMQSPQQPWHSIIVAGGSGERFGIPKPKQFYPFQGKPILLWSVSAFLKIPNLASLIVVVHPDWLIESRKILRNLLREDFPIKIVPGGKYRQNSCRRGLEAVSGDPADIVLIHDAVRPRISPELIFKIIRTTHTVGAAIPIIGVKDSLVTVADGLVLDYPDRLSLSRVQTPQGFKLEIIREAHLKAVEDNIPNAPDDGFLVLHAGYPIATVIGEPFNFKITTQEDLKAL